MIMLTEIASKRTIENLNRRGHGLGIRVGVKTSGCNGLRYVLEYVDSESEHDIVCVSRGVKIYIDPKSLVYVENLVMDWQKEGLNEGFKFINPLEESRCGCGESFSVKT